MDLEYAIQELSTSPQYQNFVSRKWLAGAAGNGFGPVLSSLVTSFLGIDNVRARVAISALFIAPFFLVSAIDIFILFPSDLRCLNRYIPAPEQSGDAKSIVNANAMSRWSRTCVWILAAWSVGVRFLVIPSLEAASVLFLEIEFQWPVRDAGYAVGCVFFASLPFVLMMDWFKKWKFPVTKLLLIETLLAFSFALLLFPPQ